MASPCVPSRRCGPQPAASLEMADPPLGAGAPLHEPVEAAGLSMPPGESACVGIVRPVVLRQGRRPDARYRRCHLRKEHQRGRNARYREGCVLAAPSAHCERVAPTSVARCHERLVLRQHSWPARRRNPAHPPAKRANGHGGGGGTAIRRQSAASTPPARSGWVN
jgi:hypothetical protein